MKIEIKPITKKENEWKPQTSVQQYFSLEKVNKIIDEEKLKDDMVCVQNVSFNSATQTFSNVVIASEKYKGEFIFLVKTENIIKNRNYFFAYITQKSWNTGLKTVLDLTIDPITSNLDLFYDNKFAGEIYIERTNNYLRCVNDTHSEVCVSIVNQKEKYELTSLDMDRRIDIFIEAVQPNSIEKTITFDPPPMMPRENYNLTIHPKPPLIIDELKQPRFLGTKTFQNIKVTLPYTNLQNLPNNDKTIQQLFKNSRAKNNNNFDDDTWNFPNRDALKEFIKSFIKLYPIFDKKEDLNNEKLLSVIDKNALQYKTSRWITIPKFFANIKDDPITDFEIDLTDTLLIFKNEYKKNHLILHCKYFLVWNRLFKIPIILIRNKGKIFGIREIVNEGVRFSFFNNKEKTDLFFEQLFTLQNALLSDNYAKFERDLLISRNAGLVNNQGSVFSENVLNQVLTASSTFLLGTLASGGNPLIGTATAIGTGAVGIGGGLLSVPFNRWKENKQIQYEKMKIANHLNTPRVEISLDSMFKMLKNNNIIYSWAWIYSTFSVSVPISTTSRDELYTGKAYCTFGNSQISLSSYNTNFALVIEQPLDCDIEKIEIDQKRYGNVVNEFKTNDSEYQNPLIFNEFTLDFLFWQGKINPNLNPIDNFQLDFLNETLARGVKIIKITPAEAEAKVM